MCCYEEFWGTRKMGRSDMLDSGLEDEELETWLQGKLEHATSLLDGGGKVQVDRIDPLRVDVALNFTVQGSGGRSDGTFSGRLQGFGAHYAGDRYQRKQTV